MQTEPKTRRPYNTHNLKHRNDAKEPIPYKYYRLWGEPATPDRGRTSDKYKTDGGGFN